MRYRKERKRFAERNRAYTALGRTAVDRRQHFFTVYRCNQLYFTQWHQNNLCASGFDQWRALLKRGSLSIYREFQTDHRCLGIDASVRSCSSRDSIRINRHFDHVKAKTGTLALCDDCYRICWNSNTLCCNSRCITDFGIRFSRQNYSGFLSDSHSDGGCALFGHCNKGAETY